jgi:hypothetical protein
VIRYLFGGRYFEIRNYLVRYVWADILGYNDDDVYLDKLQTRGVKKSILYM